MGLAVKLGNPFIKTRTRSEDVEAFNRIHAAYAEIRQSDHTYDVTICWDCMIIRAGGRRPKKVKYTVKADINWVIDKMYGEASVAVQKNRMARFSQDATDKLKSLTNLIKEGAYVYVDTEDDSILIVLGDKKGKLSNYSEICRLNPGFSEEVKELQRITSTKREKAEERARLIALLEKNGIPYDKNL